MNKKFLLVSAFIILVTGGYFLSKLLMQAPTAKKTSKTSPLPKETTVRLDKKGFSPAVVTIKVGSAVRWKNMSGDKQTVNSDDYPTNQKHKELNFGIFNDGSSVVYMFTKPGRYSYHNQLYPEQKGEIIVTK